MRIDEKIKQDNLKTVRFFYDAEFAGSLLLTQGKDEIYIETSSLGLFIEAVRKLDNILDAADRERDFQRRNDETNYPAEL